VVRKTAALVGIGAVLLLAGVVLLIKGHHGIRGSALPSSSSLKERLKGLAPERLQTTVPEPACPPALADCVRASGHVLYVQPVDSDGDGDLHVVLANRDLTIIKVPAAVRPAQNPGVGDGVGAAGQMTRGSSNEPELHADVFVVAP
jgi:hypothetical protein